MNADLPDAAHLMTWLPGEPAAGCGDGVDTALAESMAELLLAIHAVRPAEPFRTYQSWAWAAKWRVPEWSAHPASWQRAFELLAQDAPAYSPTFLHRDFGHRNLLWMRGEISGVVDWVEASTGPAWLDAGHAATNLAVAYDPKQGLAFLDAYAAMSGTVPEAYWLIMDAVGFLPPPGKAPMFGGAGQLAQLDEWLHRLVALA